MVFRSMEVAGYSCEELKAYSARFPGCRQFAVGSYYDMPELLALLLDQMWRRSLDVVGSLVASYCCGRWLGHVRTSCGVPYGLHLKSLW